MKRHGLQDLNVINKTKQTKQGVSHIVALPFTSKSISKQNEELWKLKYFTMQKCNLQKVL
jgi:hypothetical protein